MKPSSLFFCLVPTLALVQAHSPVQQAVAPSQSLSNNSPPAPLSDTQIRPEDESIPSEAQHILHLQVAGAQAKPDTISIPRLRRTALSLRTRRSSTELTPRSEGTLGQAPWIGMAIGLTCTTLAAVMLG
ncbi:hypothetical protein BDW59DRAFT_142360 [Aspergillus cavernicola]|uniref:Uncharacterized protein n=1 Tax=Aspergillus cavernicola TaxID=176166 RepID=A0ABR4IN98_9EURO